MESLKIKKRILYCEGNIDGTIGGSYFSLFFLVDGLDRVKYESTVVFHTENSLIPMYRNAGINVVVLELPRPIRIVSDSSNPIFRPFLLLFQKSINFFRGAFLQTIKYARYMKKNNIDLLHLNNSIVRNHPWMMAALLAKVKCVTHERGINLSFSNSSRFFAKHIDAIICISESVKSNMVDRGLVSKRLGVIHNAIDPGQVIVNKTPEEIRSQYSIGSDAPIIGIAGNIRRWKGQEVVIRATSLLVEKFPTIRCLIVGATAPEHKAYEAHLVKLVDKLELKNNVIFTGYKSDILNYINAMDVVIHASIEPEPFGRVLIEAMALRKPLIGARDGAVPEIIDNGVTGIICEPGNIDEYARAIHNMLTDKKNAEHMGDNGCKRLEMEFHIDRNVEKTEILYSEILN